MASSQIISADHLGKYLSKHELRALVKVVGALVVALVGVVFVRVVQVDIMREY